MKRRLVFLGVLFGSAVLGAGPVSAGGAWMDRIENVETVLAVKMDDDFPLASLMRADCSVVQFVRRPDGSGVETLRCHLSAAPVMIPEFQGQPPSTAFSNGGGSCLWTSDYWFARDESIVMASSFHYVVTPTGRINVTAYYPATPLNCE
ncbi:MAG TPA: hypothetical protein VFV72_05590 [Candidatus Limnocylindrales bacterium]|nr:hypothetical protein [Candidatus Limnocylindrales bacterium]